MSTILPEQHPHQAQEAQEDMSYGSSSDSPISRSTKMVGAPYGRLDYAQERTIHAGQTLALDNIEIDRFSHIRCEFEGDFVAAQDIVILSGQEKLENIEATFSGKLKTPEADHSSDINCTKLRLHIDSAKLKDAASFTLAA